MFWLRTIFCHETVMKNILVVSILLMLSVTGCNFELTKTDINKPQPSPKKIVDNIWTNLADCIDESLTRGDPCSATKMVLMIRHLRSVQKITDADVAKFYAKDAFEGLDKKERELTKADSDKLRSL